MTAAQPKHPTLWAITRLLKQAGFSRAYAQTPAGMSTVLYTSGFIVLPGVNGDVRVYYELGTFAVTYEGRERQRQEQAAYADVIEKAGYAVIRGGGGYLAPVIVTAAPISPSGDGG